MSTTESQHTWEKVAAEKRAALLSSIPKQWVVPDKLLPPEGQDNVLEWAKASGWFTPQELAITSLTASVLLQKLAASELSSVDVTTAFCKRAVAAQQLTSCITETCFDRALKSARARDEHLKRTGKPVGPLHGLPISLKDNIQLVGLDTTMGLVSRVGIAAESDATLVSMLEEAGAIMYAKTNVSTAMLMAESVNNIFGRTMNPRNRKTSSGGSSGGEAALIAMGGSPLGVGTDLGGSLRIPAACTGIFALRPSSGRFPYRDCLLGLPGQEAIKSVTGPMGQNLDDIEVFSRAVLAGKPWLRDPKCVPIPWRKIELPEKLNIAVMWHDGIVKPTPPVTRALQATVEKLKLAGHNVLEWDPVDQGKGLMLMARMFAADGGKALTSEIEKGGEPWRPELGPLRAAKEIGAYDMWNLHKERDEFLNKYYDRWTGAGIDAILCPVMPSNAIENGKFQHIAYTGVWNVLDYSCLSFPTGLLANKNIDRFANDYEALTPTCQKLHDEYNPELMHDLPISLQLVGRSFEEEKVIAIGRHILDTLSSGPKL